jgi:hypothetical protein
LLGLKAGDKGKVWSLYEGDPPAYEITFSIDGETEFDALMNEEELVSPIHPPFEPVGDLLFREA